MRKSSYVRLSLALALTASLWIARTQTSAPPKLTIEKVKDNLYDVVGDGGNVGVLITPEGIILIDDKYDRDHDAIMEQVKTVSSAPVKYVLSTHHHEDHSGGNVKFLAMGTQIISTTNAHNNIVEHKQANATPGMKPASITFNQEMSLFLGGYEVRARYYGRGHTNGDAVMYFPSLRTVHTGDLMAGTSPLIDYPGGGSLVEWTKTLDGALTLDFDTVIPGHGSVTNKAGLQTYRNNVEKLRTEVTAMVRQGKSQDEVGKFMMSEYKWAPNSLNMQWSLPGMMTELR